jgi:hypothetical protein
MDLGDIENGFDVKEIKLKGISLWPIVKSYLIGIEKDTQVIKETSPLFIKILLINLIPDLFSIRKMKKSKNWVFTNSERRYYINHESFDRITTGLLHYLDGYLLFENPLPKGRTKRNNLRKGEHYIGMSWIFLLQFLFMKTTRSPKVKNLNTLEAFLQRNLDKIRSIIHRILAGEIVYDFLIRKYRPQAIFVVCYYSNFELIRAAKKNNIPIIELQHGLVSKGHRAYYFSKDYGKEHLPDYFLSYGEYSTEIVMQGNLFRPNKILNYGYSFLEEVSRNLTISSQLDALKKKYKRTICITGQLPMTDVPLLQIINEVCDSFPHICFIFKPRFVDSAPPLIAKSNFMVLDYLNTYELLKYCDYHITVYSTCAMESLALGTPNISVDIKGYYSQFLKSMLEGNQYNYVVDSSEGLKKTLQLLEDKDFNQEEVKDSIGFVFSKMVSSKAFLDFFQKIIKQETNH